MDDGLIWRHGEPGGTLTEGEYTARLLVFAVHVTDDNADEIHFLCVWLDPPRDWNPWAE